MAFVRRVAITTGRELAPALLLLLIVVVLGVALLSVLNVAIPCVDGAFGLGEICGHDR